MNLTRRSDGAIVALRGTIAMPLDQYKTHLNSGFCQVRRPASFTGSPLLGSKQAAINILLATLNRKDGHGGEEGGEATKKKKKKEGVLLRPIICICNDL